MKKERPLVEALLNFVKDDPVIRARKLAMGGKNTKIFD